MWLINTSTFKLENFYSDIPNYAILSHRWKKDEELSFGGLETPHPQSDRSGYKKVKNFCAKARESNLAYAWADTCCIDKKSSAELSESINSMYTFYSQATICYVYLYDIVSLKDIEQSSWFTRGWTLQELLAPSKLHFFNQKWKPVGSRRRLAPKIERITRIPRRALRAFSPAEYCIAEKLSWSAERETTRQEDSAYCLLGLFQINMPLLYGEGARAFQRLQEEIMKISTDTSIFLWQGPAMDAFGMLASNPSCFSDIPNSIRSTTTKCTNSFSISKGWSVNNAGISIEASIHPYLLADGFECIFALHLCEPFSSTSFSDLAIFVKKHDTRQGIPAFARVTIDGVAWTSSRAAPLCKVVELRLLRYPLEDICTPVGSCGFIVSSRSDDMDLCTAYQRPFGDAETKLRSWQQIGTTSNGLLDCSFSASRRNATGLHGYLLFTFMSDIQILVCLGLSRDFQPLCIILPFCKQMLDNGLLGYEILRECDSISRGQSESFELFNKGLHMICLCGGDQILEHGADIGLSLEISDGWNHAGKLEAKITFDGERFVRYYIPTSNLSSCFSVDVMSRETFDQLLDVDLKIGAMRRERSVFFRRLCDV
jgi:hypothetical protein